MWQPAPRTDAARAAIAAARADREARPERYVLDAEQIASTAARAVDDEARFDPGWREGLTQYLGSAAEDGVTS